MVSFQWITSTLPLHQQLSLLTNKRKVGNFGVFWNVRDLYISMFIVVDCRSQCPQLTGQYPRRRWHNFKTFLLLNLNCVLVWSINAHKIACNMLGYFSRQKSKLKLSKSRTNSVQYFLVLISSLRNSGAFSFFLHRESLFCSIST